MVTSKHPALTHTGVAKMHYPALLKAAEVLDALKTGRSKTLKHVWGYDPNTSNKEHNSGRALDFMVHSDRAAGDYIADYIIANKQRLGLIHIIWRQRIYRGPYSTSSNPKGVWQGMADRGSTTQNHMDHPHVWFAGTSYTPLDPPKIPTVLSSYLTRGDSGAEVKLLQRILNTLDNAGLTLDGSFGPSVEIAVMNAQSKRKLTVDGKVGPATRDRLNAEWTSPKPTPEPEPKPPTPPPTPPAPRLTPDQERWRQVATGAAIFKDRTADDPETATRIPLGRSVENLTDLVLEILETIKKEKS